MPKGWRSYVGVTFGKEDSLPRDERKLGRERIFLGHQLKKEEFTGVFDFVPTEGGEAEAEVEGQGKFKERKPVPVVIPKVRGRVVNGVIVPGEVIAAAAAPVAESGESASASL